jgi:(2Fe-2S) ferredoxin
MLCRGCCCGSRRKHPKVDHDAHLHRLRTRVAGLGRSRTSDCLGPCERSNVAVVVPSRSARRGGATAVWLGWLLDEDAIHAIADWVRAGGPGRSEPPTTLILHQFPPPRRTAPTPS